MKQHDLSGDRKLQFDEFKLMMLGVGLEWQFLFFY